MAKSIPPHVQRFLDWLQDQWQTVFRAVRPSKEGARFSAHTGGKEREYIAHGIDAGPSSTLGIVEEVPPKRP